MKRATGRERYAVPMVLKTLQILEAFQVAGPRMSLSDVVRVCGIAKASAYRILETLRYCGYVSRAEKGPYRLTFRLLDVAGVVQERNLIRGVAIPFLEKLRQQTGETVNLGILEDNEIVYAEVLESSHNLRMVPRVGSTAPLHATALGKSVAALLPADKLAKFGRAGRLRRYTPNTIVSEALLSEELERTRERGFAIDGEEEANGCTCVAAAVVDARGTVLGAISVSAPSSRIPPNRMARVGNQVRDTARAISQRFGFISETADSFGS